MIVVRVLGVTLLHLEMNRYDGPPPPGDIVSTPAGFATGGRWDRPAIPALDVD